MFFNFPFQQLGFDDEEWDELPRTDKLIIRDYQLNNRDSDQTMLFGYYETDSMVRKVIHKYDLKNRPQLQISLVGFSIS